MNKKRYCLYLAIIITGVFICLFTGGRIAAAFTEYTDAHYWKLYKEAQKGYIAPWYSDGLHIVDEGFINELGRLDKSEKLAPEDGKVIVIGSSLSAEEYDPEKIVLDDKYDFYVFAAGGGSWRSNIVLDNLIQTEYRYTAKDIVKLEVSYSTFRYAGSDTTAETVIKKWGAYSVSSDYSVKKSPVIFTPLYNASADLMRITNVVSLTRSYFSAKDREAQIGPGNYRNNYFNHTLTASYFSVTDEKIKYIEQQLLRLKKTATPVVELSPIAPGLQATEHGMQYMKFTDDTFIPWLEKNNIDYLDYRQGYSEDEFTDGAHLGYTASGKYTRKLVTDINAIIERIK